MSLLKFGMHDSENGWNFIVNIKNLGTMQDDNFSDSDSTTWIIVKVDTASNEVSSS